MITRIIKQLYATWEALQVISDTIGGMSKRIAWFVWNHHQFVWNITQGWYWSWLGSILVLIHSQKLFKKQDPVKPDALVLIMFWKVFLTSWRSTENWDWNGKCWKMTRRSSKLKSSTYDCNTLFNYMLLLLLAVWCRILRCDSLPQKRAYKSVSVSNVRWLSKCGPLICPEMDWSCAGQTSVNRGENPRDLSRVNPQNGKCTFWNARSNGMFQRHGGFWVIRCLRPSLATTFQAFTCPTLFKAKRERDRFWPTQRFLPDWKQFGSCQQWQTRSQKNLQGNITLPKKCSAFISPRFKNLPGSEVQAMTNFGQRKMPRKGRILGWSMGTIPRPNPVFTLHPTCRPLKNWLIFRFRISQFMDSHNPQFILDSSAEPYNFYNPI